jgi:hypothetical protein
MNRLAFIPLLILFALPLAAQEAQVQQESQTEAREEEMRRSQRYVVIPKLSPDDREEFGEQVVLTEKPVEPIFTVFTDNQLLFTSNALLTRDNEESDALFISTTGFAIEPPLGEEYKDVILAFNGRFQAYRYSDHDELNFHIFSGGLTAGYQLNELWTVLTGHSYNIFYNEDTYDDFFQETAHYASINRSIPIADDLAAFVGGQAQYRNTSPARFSRMEYDLFGGLRYALDEKWLAQIYERIEYQDYLASGFSNRGDVNLLTVLSLTYYLNDWCNVRVLGSYTYNNSSLNQFKYHNFNAGGGINLTARF